jgi:hypothetical protein
MLVSPNVRAVRVPDTNPMHPQFTTIYLVGQGQVLTIESGEDMERYRWMLKGYLAAIEPGGDRYQLRDPLSRGPQLEPALAAGRVRGRRARVRTGDPVAAGQAARHRRASFPGRV